MFCKTRRFEPRLAAGAPAGCFNLGVEAWLEHATILHWLDGCTTSAASVGYASEGITLSAPPGDWRYVKSKLNPALDHDS